MQTILQFTDTMATKLQRLPHFSGIQAHGGTPVNTERCTREREVADGVDIPEVDVAKYYILLASLQHSKDISTATPSFQGSS